MRTLFAFSGKTAGGLLASTLLAVSVSTVTHASTSIFGTPTTSVAENRWYGFQSWATDTDGRRVTYSIKNKPAWASFDTRYGHLYGVPPAASVGTYSDIVISATDGISSASLPPFAITVTGTGVTGSGTGTTGSATVHWTPPTQNTNGSVLTNLAGYVINYGTNVNSLSSTVKVSNPGLTSYTIDGLAAGTYYFTVEAYNSAGGTSSASSKVSKSVK
jgi:Fibronectin type III domain